MTATTFSTHGFHVPPRQTCKLRAEYPTDACEIYLQNLEWADNAELDKDLPDPRTVLHLASDPDHKLAAEGKRTFDIRPTKTVYLEVGNCSDDMLIVEVAIRGKS